MKATLFVAIILLAACGPVSDNATHHKETITVLPGPPFLTAYAEAERPYLIDVRTPAEQASGMLAGAIPMDFRDEGFRQNAAALDTSRPVFVYCAKGGRSAGAAEVYEALGFSRVVDLEGGYSGLDRKAKE